MRLAAMQPAQVQKKSVKLEEDAALIEDVVTDSFCASSRKGIRLEGAGKAAP